MQTYQKALKNNNGYQTIFRVIIFSIAMGLFEAAVVIYLREIYYPDGFSFPLKIIEPKILTLEIFREASTLIMLIMIGFLAARMFLIRFAYFLLSFAIWDIFYYIFLKIFIDWPDSFTTWDILFLIPVTWMGPVIAPLINALTMVLLSFSIFSLHTNKRISKMPVASWILLISGSLVTIYVYILDYSSFMLQEYSFSEIMDSSLSEEIIAYASCYIPQTFNWWIFVAGELFILSGIIYFIRSALKAKQAETHHI